MLIDHIEIPVRDPDGARDFYLAALASLGVPCIVTVPPERSASGTTCHGAAFAW